MLDISLMLDTRRWMPAFHTNGLFAILAGIQPAELYRLGATFSLAFYSPMDPKHLLHQIMVGSITAHEERLRSRHPEDQSKLTIRAAQWIDYKWDVKYSEDQSELRLFVPRPSARLLGMGLPRPAWARLATFALVLEDSSLSCTNRDLLVHQSVNVAH